MFGEDNTQKLYRKLPIYCVHDTARYNLLVFARHSNIWKCVPNDPHPPYIRYPKQNSGEIFILHPIIKVIPDPGYRLSKNSFFL